MVLSLFARDNKSETCILWLKVIYKCCFWTEPEGTSSTKTLRKNPKISISKNLRLNPRETPQNRSKNPTAFIPNFTTPKLHNKHPTKSLSTAIRNLSDKINFSIMNKSYSRPWGWAISLAASPSYNKSKGKRKWWTLSTLIPHLEQDFQWSAHLQNQ